MTDADPLSQTISTDSPLWEPLTIGPVQVKHRVMVPHHGVAYGGTNLPSDRHIAYYSERAKGGAALIGVGATAVHRGALRSSDAVRVASDERTGPMYARFAERVHGYGAALFVEFAESGVHSSSRPTIDAWAPPAAASDIPSVTRHDAGWPVDKAFLDELRADYARAAGILANAGVDGITLHAAHSYFLGQFLSPAYNNRTDEYGGSLDNRCRVIVELAEAVRETVGRRIALGVRLSYREWAPGGITADMSDNIVAHLDGLGLFDYFDISAGGYHSLERSTPPMMLPDVHILDDGQRAKKIVKGDTRVFLAGRIHTLPLAESVLEAGAADMVGMMRAQMADPFLIEKARRGAYYEIRPCVGSNECVFNLHLGIGVACTVNPAVGREAYWGSGSLKPATVRRRVLVLGAGPAGMKAAEVAARRGHEVTLAERDSRLGGQLPLMAQAPGRRRWQLLVDSLRTSLDDLGVTVRLDTEVGPKDAAAFGADAVVLAVGADWDARGMTPARPDRAGIPGLENLDSWTIDQAVARAAQDPTSLGRRVVIVDETAGYGPLGFAETLASAGIELTIVTRHHYVGHDAWESHELPIVMQRLVAFGVTFAPQTIIDRIERGRVVTASIWGGGEQVIEAEAVVLAGIRHSRGFAWRDAGISDLHIAGDALAPRKPADAIYDGERIGRLL